MEQEKALTAKISIEKKTFSQKISKLSRICKFPYYTVQEDFHTNFFGIGVGSSTVKGSQASPYHWSKCCPIGVCCVQGTVYIPA